MGQELVKQCDMLNIAMNVMAALNGNNVRYKLSEKRTEPEICVSHLPVKPALGSGDDIFRSGETGAIKHWAERCIKNEYTNMFCKRIFVDESGHGPLTMYTEMYAGNAEGGSTLFIVMREDESMENCIKTLAPFVWKNTEVYNEK